MCISVLPVCMFVYHVCNACKVRSVSDLLELELLVVVSTESGSPGRAVSFLNCWANETFGEKKGACVCLHEYTICVQEPVETRRCWVPWNWNCSWLWTALWVLGTEPCSFAKISKCSLTTEPWLQPPKLRVFRQQTLLSFCGSLSVHHFPLLVQEHVGGGRSDEKAGKVIVVGRILPIDLA